MSVRVRPWAPAFPDIFWFSRDPAASVGAFRACGKEWRPRPCGVCGRGRRRDAGKAVTHGNSSGAGQIRRWGNACRFGGFPPKRHPAPRVGESLPGMACGNPVRATGIADAEAAGMGPGWRGRRARAQLRTTHCPRPDDWTSAACGGTQLSLGCVVRNSGLAWISYRAARDLPRAMRPSLRACRGPSWHGCRGGGPPAIWHGGG